MIKVQKSLQIIFEQIKTLPSKEIDLSDALGRVLAEKIHSNYDLPQFDNSAMDGYALKSCDTFAASEVTPGTLEVVEEIKAGSKSKKILKENQAAKIMTGAIIPEGADAVIKVEETSCPGNENKIPEFVYIFREVNPGENIRRTGENIKKGELVLEKGALLKAAHIGILASLGKSRVKVTQKPKVAILATGDEIVDIDEPLETGKLYSSNTYSLYSQILNSGGIPKNLGIAKDNPEDLKAKLKEGLDCDLIITSGGISMGEYDLVRSVLSEMGAEIKFWKVAVRPGKPVLFGAIEDIPIFGLPGNPVSSMVCFEIFVRLAILKMLGQNISPVRNCISNGVNSRKEMEAILEEDIKKKKGFRYFLRAQTRWENGTYRTRTTGPQGSGILKSMALANSLIILPEDDQHIEKGKTVKVKFLE